MSKGEVDLLRSLEPIRPKRSELRALRRALKEGEDPLGDEFCRLFKPAERRQKGAVYTPAAIVDAMVNWASEGPAPERIVDPGSGSARFATAAGNCFPKAKIIAVELDPVAGLLARATFAAKGQGHRAEVVIEDYRSFFPSTVEGQTLYIGNPPYVRHHQISPTWKQWLTQAAAERGLRASQLSGLHLYFVLATAIQARPGDRGAFITSSEWLDVNYGSLMRELLLDGLGGQSVHVLAPDAEPFENAQTTGAITCFEIGAKPKSLRLKRVKAVTELDDLKGGQRVRRERLAEAKRWSPLLRTARKVPDGYIELGDICRVHRGAVTGANRVWVVDPDESDLPSSVLFRAVTRARELFAAGAALSGGEKLRAVVGLPSDLSVLDEEERRPVERFLKAAKRQGVHEGYIAKSRPSWWSVDLRDPAPILATYMARRPPAIVRNLADARNLNIAHGIYPREELSVAVVDRLAKAIRSSVDLAQGRAYAGGLIKFEPSEFERILVPNVVA
ncbi:MAG: Eco57I restriction-modification methylase domain-containing protein [Solirubrobacterales bacterium]